MTPGPTEGAIDVPAPLPVSSVRGVRFCKKMSSPPLGTVAKTSSQARLPANHLQAIRAIRIESGQWRRSRVHIFQIFFHRRLRALRAPRDSRFSAARALLGRWQGRCHAADDASKALMESVFPAF